MGKTNTTENAGKPATENAHSFARLERQIIDELKRLGSALERDDFSDAGRLLDLLNDIRNILGERRFNLFLRGAMKRHAPAFRRALAAHLAA